MALPSDDGKTIRLRGKEGEPVEVPEKSIAAASATIKGVIDEGRADAGVDLPSLSAAALSRVAEYVKRHFKDGAAAPEDDPGFYVPGDDDPLARFDDELVRVDDNDVLIDLIEAATFLGIDGLMDLACKAVAEQMKGKNAEEIRKKFNIVNDYTKEEEEEVRRENSWAFE
ncbi:unnamed protein product [Urochloa decumbens]|uniref:SKP1-like protein n=1 Tax=Urochloa decumbens TaxID=240449 RepID=A0ABC9A013_9POAL